MYSPRLEAVHLRFAVGGPRRPALVRPAGGLPHRDPGPGQGAGGQELGHRALRGQGRVRLQAPARPVRPGGLPGRGAGLLPDLHPRHAGRDRQPAKAARWCRRPGWSGTTATTPTWWWPRTRAPPPSPTPPTRSPEAYGYWLGDAFASGGSEGYDHKKMGITARGAWESVKFHFATLGVDTDTDRLHRGRDRRHVRRRVRQRHAAVASTSSWWPPSTTGTSSSTPTPTRPRSFAERQRLFALPRSSWADYKARADLGGRRGVAADRQVGAGVPAGAPRPSASDDGVHALTPDQLISAILAAPVDLLWNGGIGTYVKASTETHADAGDRANDAVRIDAPQLRAQVVAEGGNLGLTQAARIEYALAGGLVNTDFIDNSAGVDTSDHEVNIKILLQEKVTAGDLTADARGELLHEMTGEVAALVLRENYHQNRALAAARAQAAQMLHVHARYLRKLERDRRIARRHRLAARRQGDRRAPVGGPGPDRAGVRGPAGPGQDLRGGRHPRLRPARRPVPARRCCPPTSRRRCGSPTPAEMGRPPAAAGDHHHRRRQRHGGPVRDHLPVPHERGDGRVRPRHERRLAGGPRGLRHGRVLGPGGGARRPGGHGHPDRPAAGGAQADRARGPVAAAQPAPAVRHPGHHRLLRPTGWPRSAAACPSC